ncbi:U3 snoRNP protein Utp20 [Coprinopsis sp. MPI-PUGE-AT-0042]|nr:U3 snoRNP protein Utp20 [Coprinopsis sp. MPI-PUGE-AT-0042]
MDDDEGYEPPQAPQKRFKHQSYQQQLKEVHLPSAFRNLEHETEVSENDSHFHQALEHWRQLNLAGSFIQFATKADPLSGSMALLLHHWKDVIGLWAEAMEASDDEGLLALLDLLQKFVHDLRTTIAPVYKDVLQRLLDLLPSLNIPSRLDDATRNVQLPATLPKCLPEIQRAMAEVWGSVLRKLKTTARAKAVTMLARAADPVDDASAWVLVYACKSVSQTLHTATPSIFSPLLTYHLEAEEPEATFNLLRRSLTALIHHVKTDEQFAELGNVIIQQLQKVTQSSDDEHTRRALEVVTVIASVRQGSRVTDTQKAILVTQLDSLPIHSRLEPAILPFFTAIFTTTEMSHWIGPGLKFLQRMWGLIERRAGDDEDAVCLTLGLKLHGALAELGWGGWKMIALPLVLKATVRPSLLEQEPRKLFSFLASLRRLKKLSPGEVDMVWKAKIEKCALARLEVLKGQAGDAVDSEINDILSLSPFFSEAVAPVLLGMIDYNLQPDIDPAMNERRAWIVDGAVQALSRRDAKEWTAKVPLQAWALLAVEKWSSSRYVLGSLVVLSEAIPAKVSRIPFETAYPSLQPSLLSHSRSLRLNALRFLNSKLVAIPEETEEVVKRCLQGEEASVDIQGVRERVLRIGRVAQVVGDRKSADICGRWLLAQLKVNLRPLWSPAIAALSALSQRFGDLVWQILFEELKASQTMEGLSQKPLSHDGHSEVDQASEDSLDKDRWEEERSWRDPSGHKLRVVSAQWNDETHSWKEYIQSHQQRGRFDPAGYEFQVLTALGECASLVEQHNRELIPYFLNLLNPTTDPATAVPTQFSDARISKQKLIAWLTLFSKFSNPKALYLTSTLKAIYVFYLSHPYRPLQKVALACLLGYKSPHLSSHGVKLNALLDDTTWRDELTTLELSNLSPQERGEVVDVLTRILFGMMLEKRGKSRGTDRRAAVLTAFGSCTSEELGLLIDLMLQPLGLDRNSHNDTESKPSGFTLHSFNGEVDGSQMVGFLTLLADLMRLLGSRLVAFWPALLGGTIDVVNYAQAKIQLMQSTVLEGTVEEEGDLDEDSDEVVVEHSTTSSSSPKMLRRIRQLGLKRFADFFRVPVSFAFEPYLSVAFSSFISPRLPALAQENIQSPSALLHLFQVWSQEPSQVIFLVQFDDRLLPSLYNCLVATNVKPAVVDCVFGVVEKIIEYAEDDATVASRILEPHVDLLLTNLAKLVEYAKHAAPPQKPSASNTTAPTHLSLSLTTPLGQRHLSILSMLAPYSKSSGQAITLLNLFLPVFRKPNKQAPERVKANILIIIRNMMRLVPDLQASSSALWRKVFDSLSQLLLTLKTRIGRTQLVDAFNQLGALVQDESSAWVADVAEKLASLNAFSVKRLDEPDFDRRLAAYSVFNDSTEPNTLAPLAWVPLIRQAFHDIQDGEELAVRAAAAHTLRRFIDATSASLASPPNNHMLQDESYRSVYLTVYLPGIRSLISTPLHVHSPNLQSSLSVKADLLSVLSYTISQSPDAISPTVRALRPLLEGGDDEANFFNNVLHIQIHRRTRAVRRLGERCDKEGFGTDEEQGASVIRDWLIPIVSWFIGNGGEFSKTKDANSSASNPARQDQQTHLTTNEAITALGKLSKRLPWAPYYALVQRYLRLAKAKTDWEKVYVRAIVSILEHFEFEITDGEEEVTAKDPNAMDVDPVPEDEKGGAVELEVGQEEESENEEEAVVDAKPEARPKRRHPRILTSLKAKLLPALLTYLSPPGHRFEEDQNPLTVRLPISIAITRLVLLLPVVDEQDVPRKKTELRRLATELSHMIRSRSQETRDSVREVLGKMAILVLGIGENGRLAVRGGEGSSFDRMEYLRVLIEELQIALTRGPQLHVLAVTVQSIVTKVTLGLEEAARLEQMEGVEEPNAGDLVSANDARLNNTSAANEPQPAVLLDNIVPLVSHIASAILFGDVATIDREPVPGGMVPVNHASTSFREPKKSTNSSYTLYALAAQFSSPSVLPSLLKDVKSVMKTTSNMKVMSVVDEVLRRVGGGLERNPGIERNPGNVDASTSGSDWLLNVIWGLVSGNVAFLKERAEPFNVKGKKNHRDKTTDDDRIVHTKRFVKEDTDHYTHNSFKFVVLGLDLLNTALRRNRFASASPTTFRQLDSLLPVIGNTLYSTSTPVLLTSLKSVSLLVTRFAHKLPGMRRALPVYVNQVISIIRTSGGGGGSMGGTDGDLLQVALRTLGVMIRDGPKTTTDDDGKVNFGVEVKEKDLSFLLDLVTPDLEDPDKQNVAFTLLRAIVSRRFIVPEMYDIMEERVAPLLVQSQSAVVREQGRALLLQFMLDYPQGKGRLQKTLAFLLRNSTSYVHESGRVSIFELLGAVLTKFQSGLIQEYGEMVFVTLVMALANDESTKCKEMAASLLTILYGRFDAESRKTIVRSWLKKWVSAGVQSEEGGKKKLAWVALQVWGVVVDAAAKEQEADIQEWVKDTLDDITVSLEDSKLHLDSLIREDSSDGMEVDGTAKALRWHLPYYSLTALGKVLRAVPTCTRSDFDSKSGTSLVPWNLVSAHLLFPHAWVRTAACRCVGILFNAYPSGSTSPPIESPTLPEGHPFGPGGLRSTAEKLCDQLKSENLDSALGLQVVKNLVWIGKRWSTDDSDATSSAEGEILQDGEHEDEDDAGEADVQLDNLPWLFSKLSYQVRGALIRRRGRHGRNNPNWSQQPLAVVRWFAAMTTALEPARLERFLTHILSPVYRIIEEDTIRDEQIEELKSTSIELRELVQQKVGGTAFSMAYNTIRQKVLEVQRERRTKRVMLGTQHPEQAARRKEKKLKLKKESKKRRTHSFVDSRGGKRRRKED